MSKSKAVPYVKCECGKRGWVDEMDAEKALGKAQTKRNRAATMGTRRGLHRESRTYYCDYGDCYHLTSQSRRTYQTYASDEELTLVAQVYDLASMIPAQEIGVAA